MVVTVTVRQARRGRQFLPVPCVTVTVYHEGSPSAGVTVVTHIRGNASWVSVIGLLLLFGLNGRPGLIVPVTIMVFPGPCAFCPRCTVTSLTVTPLNGDRVRSTSSCQGCGVDEVPVTVTSTQNRVGLFTVQAMSVMAVVVLPTLIPPSLMSPLPIQVPVLAVAVKKALSFHAAWVGTNWLAAMPSTTRTTAVISEARVRLIGVPRVGANRAASRARGARRCRRRST